MGQEENMDLRDKLDNLEEDIQDQQVQCSTVFGSIQYSIVHGAREEYESKIIVSNLKL